MQIIADTATLLPPGEKKNDGLTIIPISVAINGHSYRDYSEISSAEFLEQIHQGGIPTSSQPAIGDLLEVMEETDEDLLVLTVGDGLSGGFQSAMGARNLSPHPERIHIIDSKSLGGPLRYLARKAVALKERGLSIYQIKDQLQASIDSSVSFVIPEDFDFLKRSGRLTSFTAKIGSTLKLLPVLTQTKDMKRICPIGIKRGWKSAVNTVLQQLQARNVGRDDLISICHAGVPQRAQEVLGRVKERFASTEVELLELSPALIAHGGPGCIVIQSIHK